MGGLATGAERVYLHEEGVTLDDLRTDLSQLVTGFKGGKRLALMIRNENVNPFYTTPFMCALFEEEGQDFFDVRQSILGHLQQGGDPTPFDRIQATQLADKCIEFLIQEAGKDSPAGAFVGLEAGQVQFHSLDEFPRMTEAQHQRPKEQWWMNVRPIAKVLAQPGPHSSTKGS
jgi:6-phosphofructokinase 1